VYMAGEHHRHQIARKKEYFEIKIFSGFYVNLLEDFSKSNLSKSTFDPFSTVIKIAVPSFGFNKRKSIQRI